jgi:hypothetical protein
MNGLRFFYQNKTRKHLVTYETHLRSIKHEFFDITCSRRSRRGLVQEDKRTVFAYTHGLFIT